MPFFPLFPYLPNSKIVAPYVGLLGSNFINFVFATARSCAHTNNSTFHSNWGIYTQFNGNWALNQWKSDLFSRQISWLGLCAPCIHSLKKLRIIAIVIWSNLTNDTEPTESTIDAIMITILDHNSGRLYHSMFSQRICRTKEKGQPAICFDTKKEICQALYFKAPLIVCSVY